MTTLIDRHGRLWSFEGDDQWRCLDVYTLRASGAELDLFWGPLVSVEEYEEDARG